jgi:replication factor C subunit 3/5
MASMTSKENIPWVEKYRPTKFTDIVLDPINRQMFQHILDRQYFPNLLFYGPPGTGKTTTIINMINEYQIKHHQKNKGMMIHLNASDERGIDIIRNQIYQFVKSKNFFEVGLKFVILDEVDYMTKNAQQALKYLLQSSCYNVRFCLICNYISKIDDSLKNEFLCMRFNQLPKEDIFRFIGEISKEEHIPLSKNVIQTIQQMYHSDIRSMINFIQLNQNVLDWESNILTPEVWQNIHRFLCADGELVFQEKKVMEYIQYVSIHYNIDKKNIIKNYFLYILFYQKEYICPEFLDIVEKIMHTAIDTNLNNLLSFFINQLHVLYCLKK